MDVHKIDWNAMPWTFVREGVERKAFSGDDATIALHRLMPGHEPKPHSHPHAQIAYIISGTMRFHVGDTAHVVGPGGLLYIPGDVMHWGEVIGDEPVINLDVFTPCRPEYAPAPNEVNSTHRVAAPPAS
jgi:quercetin dioxygenase-like cupin family protein